MGEFDGMTTKKIGGHLIQCTVFYLLWLIFSPYCPAETTQDRLESRQPAQSRPELPAYLPKVPEGGFVLPPAPLPSRPVPGAVTFDLKGVLFVGNTVVPTADLQQVAAPFVGKSAGIGELEELRHRLTRLYVDRGFINSGAILKPGQNIIDGVVTYTIEEGRLNRIEVTGNERLAASYIEKRLWPDPEKPFNTNELQDRFQMLLQDPMIKRMDGRIRPGTSPGEAILDLNATRSKPYGLSIAADNHRPPSTGAERLVASGYLRNLTGWGDLLDASFGISEGADETSVGFAIPLNSYDTLFSARYSRNNNSVIEEPLEDVDIESESENADISISHPLFRDVRSRLDTGVSLGVRESKTFLLGRLFSFSPGVESGACQVSAVRMVLSYVHRESNRALALRSTVSLGMDIFGSTLHSEDLPDSRYLTWLGQAQFAQRLGENFGQLHFRGDIQLSSDRLLPPEQFAVGGATTVRGYRENTLVRDNGCVLSLEWRYPLWRRQVSEGTEALLQVVPFMDYGSAWNCGENNQHDTLNSLGVGLIFTPCSWMSAEIYWAHDLKERKTAQNYNLQDDGLHFQVRFEVF